MKMIDIKLNILVIIDLQMIIIINNINNPQNSNRFHKQ